MELLLETKGKEMEPRFSLVFRDNPLAEGGGNMPNGGEKTATPSVGDKDQNGL